MKSSMLIPMAALTLALSASSALQADPQERDRRHDDRYDDRYNDRYDDRNDGRSGDRYDSRRVAALAHEIEQTAYSIRREAERNNRRPNRWEARMLSALRELNQEANQFHAQVESRRYDNRSGRGFEDLVQAYRETGYIVSRNDPRPYLDRGMERIGDLLSEISQSSGRRGDYRWDRNDRRYDRDQDGRDWDRWDRDHGHN
jgi:hypothetical protein